jgi:hypothetical protein
MASLAEIRAKLQAAEQNKPGQSSSGGDNAIYPHWNIDEGASAKFRFLPDANQNNTFFWIERAIIKLPFNGVKGEADSKHVEVQVPCMEMWNEACPILAEVRPWFKDASLADMGKKYWKKRSYIFQGFVRDNPLTEDKKPENPIRRFIIGPQIFPMIKSALMDPELEELPTDYTNGLDFTITKTSKGGYADYNTSKWSRKESALASDELAAIEKYGLFDLAEFLPKKPGATELRIIKEMFEASVDGQPYDAEKWGQYYRPYGMAAKAESSNSAELNAEFAHTESAPSVVTKPTEVLAAAAPAANKAEDILAMIRSRQKQ